MKLLLLNMTPLKIASWHPVPYLEEIRTIFIQIEAPAQIEAPPCFGRK